MYMTATDLATSLLSHPDDEIADAWTDALDAVEGVADSFQDFIATSGYVEAERAYVTWALTALSTLTAYANELSDEELSILTADMHAHPYTPPSDMPEGRRGRLYFATDTAERMITYRIDEAARPNLDQLKTLSYPCYQAGLAVLLQGVVEYPELTDILAGPWIRRGHPFPRHESIAWNSPRWQGRA